jgi:hypothetical protein
MTGTVVAFEEDKPRPKLETLAIEELTLDNDIAAREIDFSLVDEYAERMKEGDEFPRVQAITDGETCWLVDGRHRLRAATQCGIKTFRCLTTKGDRRTALLASASVNAQHGRQRSYEEKRRAIDKLIKDPEWSKWSDREIARQCRVSNNFVSDRRRELRARAVAANLTVTDDSERLAISTALLQA